MMRKRNCLTFISFVLMLSGLVFALCSYTIHLTILKNLLDLTPGSILYKEWMKPSPPMTFDVYFFNWTNPADFFNSTKKLKVKEIGPFRFDLRIEKSNVTYNEANHTMTYEMKRWYRFNREESIDDLNMEITILNQLATAAAYKAQDMGYIMRKSVAVGLNSLSSVSMTKTVGQLLFEGSSDLMLDVFRKLPTGIETPDKFGFFYQKNGSSDGVFSIGTGIGGNKLGMLNTWNGKIDSNSYGESCRRFNGTAMDFYTDNMKDSKIGIFNPELCRSMTLDYSQKKSVNGVEGEQFEIDKSFLDNGTFVRGNECFCDDQCIRYGAVPASLCIIKTNNYISLPHLLKADTFFQEKIDGLEPDKDKHNFQILIEPVTGFLLEMKARLQMNIYVQPIPGISMFEEAPTVLFPIMWFEQSLKIPEEAVFSLGILLSIKGIIICVGIFVMIIGIIIYVLFISDLMKRRKFIKDDDRYYLPAEMNPLNNRKV